MSSTFNRFELRALAPADLADLLRMAAAPDSDNQPWGAAMLLGLDPTNPNDRKAVEAAWDAAGYLPDPYSPPIGGSENGVRSDLTPDILAGQDADEEMDLSDGLPQPDPEGALAVGAMLEKSRTTGEPFMAGTYALYADPSGAVVMVTEDATGHVRRSVVPRKVVKLAIGLMAGERQGKNGMLLRVLGFGRVK